MTNHDLPPDWGNDHLTNYLETFRHNQFATFVHRKEEVQALIAIDALFQRLVGGAVDPVPLLSMGFLQRAHSAYRAACGAIMGGQLGEAQSLLRNCLEQSGYAFYVGRDYGRWKRWMDRHEPRSKTQQDKWREEFSHGKVVSAIAAADTKVGQTYKELYERTIDYGAHPNQMGDTMGSSVEETEGEGLRLWTIYLHEDGLLLEYSLRSAAQVGLCALLIAQLIYPARMQATGVKFDLEDLAKQF